LEFLQVRSLLVDASLNIDAVQEVTEKDARHVENVILAQLEMIFNTFDHQVLQEVAILVVDHAITEHTSVLMKPET
jgi:hypothetical protein